MRSPLGALLAGIVNRAPVPMTRSGPSSWLTQRRQVGDYDTQMQVYGSNGTVFSIVARLSSATAGVEWKMYRKSASGNDDDRTEVTSHGVLDLIEKPNDFMSRMDLMEAAQQHSELVGEMDLLVGRIPGVKYPTELWPVLPQRLTPVPDPYAFLKGWVYRGPDGESIPLELNELIRHRLPNPLDPYRGLGPIQAILLDLDTEKYGKEWQKQFFKNSAQPGGVLQVDRRLNDGEFDEMTTRWREQHQGVNKAHRVAIIENGAQWVDAKITQRDMQFAELAALGERIPLTAFGMPKFMIGQVDDVNRANAEAGEYVFAKWLIKDRLNRWRGMYNRQLLPMFGDDIARKYELDYVDPVPANSELAIKELDIKSKALVLLTGAGYDVPQLLDFFGWPALDYERPPEPTVIQVPAAPPGKTKDDPVPADHITAFGIEDAMRWVVEAHSDDSVCEPCETNDGKVYRNRSDAYKDYPNGKGYVKCVGAEFGNECRCVVKKRRKSDSDE